jgi:8-oxo-dGTP pyrophosphatase MutT (NUDIX family)
MSGSRRTGCQDRSDAGRVFGAVPNSTTPPCCPADHARRTRRRLRFSRSRAAAGRAPPRPAATIVVVRDGADGIEVLLSRRAERGDHNSDAWVFPGGIVEKNDALAHAAVAGLDDAEASRRLGLASGGLDYYVAAIRECFEESGLLFARAAGPELVDLDGSDAVRLAPWRGALHRGEKGIVEFCAAEGLHLAADRLVYLSHWLTPLGRAKRFDTRFFIAAVPTAQTAAHDGAELLEQMWIAPQGGARAQGIAEAAHADAEDARDDRPLRARRRGDGVGVGAAPGRARDAARRERPRRLSAGHARRVSVGRARPHRSGRPRQRVVRARPDRAVRLSSASSGSPPTTAAS